MAREKKRFMGFFGDMIKLGVVVLLLGGVIYFFIGDKIMRTKELHNVTMYYEVDADKELEEPVDKLVKKSFLWKSYFKHLPDNELTEEKFKIQVETHFKREENPSNRTDGEGTSRNYSPGKLLLRLRVRQKARDKTLYTKIYDWELKPIIIPNVNDVISEKKGAKEFEDKEKEVIKHDLPAYLELAAIHMMEKRTDQHDQYAEAIALTVGNKNETLAKAAYSAFKDMRLETATLEAVQTLVKKERLKAKGAPRETGLNKILEYVAKQLKRHREKDKS